MEGLEREGLEREGFERGSDWRGGVCVGVVRREYSLFMPNFKRV